ncbi:TlpA disulfide reductase family protein [Lutibacter citreus]|uniref:TlpA disulfide reductase family protein n=1 Tax=Lutibacter citreus TaxID=2138210 RepID=UPI000DBE1530|nr:TlpA disulfide reductase family protein [Lutibacter citreus]
MIKIAKIISTVLFLLIITSCTDKKEAKIIEGYTIHGNVPNAVSKTAYLFNNNNILIDSASIKNNYFEISGNSETIQFASIQLKQDELTIPFVLENVDYQLYASSKKQLIFGGKSQQSYNSYIEGLDQVNQSKLLLINEYGKLKDSKGNDLNKSLDSINKSILTYKMNSLNTINFNPIKTIIIQDLLKNNQLSIENTQKIEELTATLSNPELSTSVQLKLSELKAIKLKNEQKLAKAVVKRQLAPMFSGESLNGSDLNLASILKGKKAVLLDFWASWCGPCRQVTPQIRSLYMKYKNKGFDIITISEDKNRNSWKSGLAEDQILDWNHIYDDNFRIAYMYNVSSIPHMVLIDGNGGIIDRKISFSRLNKELKSICR